MLDKLNVFADAKLMRQTSQPRRRVRSVFVLALLVLALAIVFGLGLTGREPRHEGKRLLLAWSDPGAGVTFRVTEDPGAIVKQNSRLHVESDGRDQAVLLDDDAMFSTVTFVRFEHWLLVVCRGVNEVWGGYDYDTKKMYGEYDWSKLPFRTWSGQGNVVAERRIRADSGSPAGFPRP